MHKIAVSLSCLVFLVACSNQTTGSQASDPDEWVALADSSCLNMPDPTVFLPKAEAGDPASMSWARSYYSDPECGNPNPDLDLKKALYWGKRVADLGASYDLGWMYSTFSGQLYPINPDNSDPIIKLDPLLLWAWKVKYCAHPETIRKCSPSDPPEGLTREQWENIISSPPRTDDTSWFQYLPEGCEQGQCLPK